MEQDQEISVELREISPLLADIQAVNRYTVPEGYFAALPEAILEKIRIEATLAGATANIYSVPAGYFEGLAGEVLSKIKAVASEASEELDEVAPLLNSISKKNIYSVPAGYFETADFAQKAQNNKKEGKVFTLRIARTLTQYAAAAVFAGMLVMGAFLFTDNKAYLQEDQNQRIDVSSALNKVSEDELAKYVDNPEHAIAAPATTSLASEDELVDVKNHIRQVSDEELDQYLKENGESFDQVVSEKNN